MYREDCARGGYRVYAVDDPSGIQTAWQMAATSVGLAVASLIPYATGLAGAEYFAAAAGLGVVVAYVGLKPLRDPLGSNARQVFLASLVYLPSIYALLVAAQ